MSASDCEHKYKAFISYCSDDLKKALRLHRQLESYRLSADIAQLKNGGRRKLGKFFLAHVDLNAGDLWEQLTTALGCSEHLIVVCSPKCRLSGDVAREIELFRALGRGKILAVIADGEPRGGANDCFPEALRRRSDCAKALPVLPLAVSLAADLRPDKDGEHLAKLKLVAGLVGADLDELRKRDWQAERNRRVVATGFAAGFAVVAGAAGWYWFEANRERKTAERMTLVAEQRLDQSIKIASDIADKVAEKAIKIKIPGQQALELQNDLSQVLDELTNLTDNETLKLKIMAEHQLRLADTAKSITKLDDWSRHTAKATEHFEELVRLEPDNYEYQKGLTDARVQLALSYQEAGRLDDSKQEFQRAMALPSQLMLSYADFNHPQTGDKAREVRFDLSTMHLEIGILAKRQGRVIESYRNLEDALRLRQEIEGRAGGDHVDAARAVTEAVVELSDARGLAGEHVVQTAGLMRVVERRRELVALSNEPKLKRLLGWALVFLSEANLESNDAESAIRNLKEAREIQEKLYQTDDGNARLQKDLAWAEGYLGDAYATTDRLQDAIAHYTQAIEILERRYKADIFSPAKTRDWGYWLTRRGGAYRRLGKLDLARADLEPAESLLRSALLELDLPNKKIYRDATNLRLSAEWASSQVELSRLEADAGNYEIATAHLAKAREELSRVVKAAPRAERWRKLAKDAGLELPKPEEDQQPVMARPTESPATVSAPAASK